MYDTASEKWEKIPHVLSLSVDQNLCIVYDTTMAVFSSAPSADLFP